MSKKLSIHQAKTLSEARHLAHQIANTPVTYADIVLLTYPGWVSEQIPRGLMIHDRIKGGKGAEIRQRLYERLINNWKWNRENDVYHAARVTIAKEIRANLRRLGIACSLAQADRTLRCHILRTTMVPELTMKGNE